MTFLSVRDILCRRKIEMSPLCQFEMTGPWVLLGEFGWVDLISNKVELKGGIALAG